MATTGSERGDSSANSSAPGTRTNRRFSVSSNRGSAKHRIRYVETGGASVDIEECTFCQSNPALDWATASGTGACPKGDDGSGEDNDRQDDR